jgi:hypothetical protein
MGSSSRVRRLLEPRILAPAVFALLVVATIAAFGWAQHLKTEPLVVDKVVFRPGAFTPNADCRRDRGRVRFRLTRSDRVTAEILTQDDRRVRRLYRDRPTAAYRFVVIRWDGRDDAGTVLAPGPYKLRLTLLDQDRTLIPPGRFRVHEAPSRPRRSCARREAGGPD